MCQRPEPSGQGKGVTPEPRPDPPHPSGCQDALALKRKLSLTLSPPSLAYCPQEGNLPAASYLPIYTLSSLLAAGDTAHIPDPALHSSTGADPRAGPSACVPGISVGTKTPQDLTVGSSSRCPSFMQSQVSHAQDCYRKLARMNTEGKRLASPPLL